MPIYVYEVVQEDDQGGEQFEITQAMSDPELTRHPVTGRPIRRVIAAPNIVGKWSTSGEKARLSDKNLAEMGFTKYVREGDGKYQKTVGQGPDRLSAD